MNHQQDKLIYSWSPDLPTEIKVLLPWQEKWNAQFLLITPTLSWSEFLRDAVSSQNTWVKNTSLCFHLVVHPTLIITWLAFPSYQLCTKPYSCVTRSRNMSSERKRFFWVLSVALPSHMSDGTLEFFRVFCHRHIN